MFLKSLCVIKYIFTNGSGSKPGLDIFFSSVTKGPEASTVEEIGFGIFISSDINDSDGSDVEGIEVEIFFSSDKKGSDGIDVEDFETGIFISSDINGSVFSIFEGDDFYDFFGKSFIIIKRLKQIIII